MFFTPLRAVIAREFFAYFATPLAYVFLVLFLFSTAFMTFYVGRYLSVGQADLGIFFSFHPWLHLFFLSAIAMRLWSDEWRQGSIELLLTLPISLPVVVVGKFLAAWGFAAIALFLTAPIWFSVNYLGTPDNGVIAAGYLGSLLMAGSYLALGTAGSALTRNPVIAFVVTLSIGFLFTISGLPLVLETIRNFLPDVLIDTLASFSFLAHFRSITAGVIDLRDIIFFASLIVASLAVTGVIIETKKGARTRQFYHIRARIGIILIVVIFVAVNLAANIGLRHARLDLTENRAFTLDSGSLSILRNLEEPLTLKFYYSQRLAANIPALRFYGQRVRDILEEIVTHAEGKIKLDVIDPPAFSDIEEQAVAQGLVAQPINTGELLYFGLAGFNLVDQIEIIPWFGVARAQYLEYDLMRLIYNLNTPIKPALGVISNLPLDTGTGGLMAALQGQSQPFLIYSELTDRFDVRFLNMQDSKIPAEIRVLLIAHPRPLSPQMLYAIDQFVMRGGRVIGFIDPYSEVSLTAGANGSPLPGHTAQSSLAPLMETWGVDMDGTKIIADRLRAQRVATGHDARRQLADYILWMALKSGDMNSEDIITANIDQLNIGTAGALTHRADATSRFTPLVSSSADAALYPRDYVISAPTPDALLARFTPEGQYVIAARIEGTVRSAFLDGAPPLEDGEQSARPHIAATDSAHIVLFADSDFFDDRFWVNEEAYLGQRFGVPIADNAKFLLNAVENLIGARELISLRGRERAARPFTRLETLRRAAEMRYRERAQKLRDDVAAAQDALDALEREGNAQARVAAANYRRELLAARRALRDVEAELRRDIEYLTTQIRWFNILAAPLLVLIFGAVVVRVRLYRLRAHKAMLVSRHRALSTNTGETA